MNKFLNAAYACTDKLQESSERVPTTHELIMGRDDSLAPEPIKVHYKRPCSDPTIINIVNTILN